MVGGEDKGGEGHAGRRRPRSATCMQIIHLQHDERHLVFQVTLTVSPCITLSLSLTEVPTNHLVLTTESAKRRLPKAPRTAAAVDHHFKALIATTSQDGRHTSGTLALPCPRPLVTTSKQESQLFSTGYIELINYAVGAFLFLNLSFGSLLGIKGVTQAETRLTPY